MTVRDLLKSVPGAVSLVRYVRRLNRPDPYRQYWEKRKHLRYYQEVLRLARKHCPHAGTVIDVGSMNSPFILQFDWISHKATLDLGARARLRGCTGLRGDFMTYQFQRPFDLVLCLQVLEHLEDPAPFARKLLATGTKVIISVPYRWPKGAAVNHIQDPVDDAKLLAWTGRQWIDRVVARELTGKEKERLIVVLDGVAASG